MALPYWTISDLESRLGREVVIQVFDDDNDGVPDAGAVDQLSADSDSFVEGYLRGVYELATVRDAPPNQVKRLSLDYAVAQCAKRRPEYVRRDFGPLEAAVRQELSEIRSGKIRLDVIGAPEPGANQGGEVWDGGDDYTEDTVKFFSGGMGDF